MSRPYLPMVRARSWAEIEREALALLRRHYPHAIDEPGPVPVGHFLEILLPKHYRVDFHVAPLPHPTEGITTPGDSKVNPNITLAEPVYDRLQANDGRARFTSAHECYHGLSHAWELKVELVSGEFNGLHRKTDIPPYRNPERQADVFASRFLMPGPAVKQAHSHYGPDVQRLAEIFQVSAEAMSYRLRELGIGW